MYYFGLRASEVALIRMDALDLARNRIWISRRKSGISAEYPLPRWSRFVRRLKAYLETRGFSEWDVLFLSLLKIAHLATADFCTF